MKASRLHAARLPYSLAYGLALEACRDLTELNTQLRAAIWIDYLRGSRRWRARSIYAGLHLGYRAGEGIGALLTR